MVEDAIAHQREMRAQTCEGGERSVVEQGHEPGVLALEDGQLSLEVRRDRDRTQQDDSQDGEDHYERNPYPASVLEPDLFDLTRHYFMLRRA